MSSQHTRLTEAQQRSFHRGLERLGLDADEVADHLDTGDHDGGFVVGGEGGAVSGVRTVEALDELRELLGQRATARVEVPPVLAAERAERLARTVADVVASSGSRARARDALSLEEGAQLALAEQVFLHGDPETVASWRPVLERTLLPAEVRVHAATNVTVRPGNPLIFHGPGPVTATYGTVTVEAGAQILCETQVTLKTQTFTAE